MADDTSGAATQADADATKPPAGDQKTPPSQADSGAAPAAESITLDEARKLRKEAQQLRRDRDAVAQKLKEFEDAKLSETEKLQKELKVMQDAQAQWAVERRERDARDAVIEAASDEKVAARNPRAVYKLVRDDLEYDDAGRVTNLAAVLKAAKADYPELFGRSAGSADGGAGARNQAAGFDMNAAIRQLAGRG